MWVTEEGALYKMGTYTNKAILTLTILDQHSWCYEIWDGRRGAITQLMPAPMIPKIIT